jgi:hypothetical protein
MIGAFVGCGMLVGVPVAVGVGVDVAVGVMVAVGVICRPKRPFRAAMGSETGAAAASRGSISVRLRANTTNPKTAKIGEWDLTAESAEAAEIFLFALCVLCGKFLKLLFIASSYVCQDTAV